MGRRGHIGDEWDEYDEISEIKESPKLQCHAQKDGDCFWKDCPQLRDDEPKKSGRHCPLDTYNDDDTL